MYSSVAVLATLALGTLAQDATTSVSGFFLGGPTVPAQSWGASVISAGADGTAYEIYCTGGTGCPSTARDFAQTITLAPTGLNYVYTTEVEDVAASVHETCTISGTTAAVCTIVASLQIDDESSTTASTATYSGDEFLLQPVTITAGLNKLASVSASATGTGAGASGSAASSGAGSSASSGAGSSASSSARGSTSSGASASASSVASASASSGGDTSGAQSAGRAGDVMALVVIPSVAVFIGALLML